MSDDRPACEIEALATDEIGGIEVSIYCRTCRARKAARALAGLV